MPYLALDDIKMYYMTAGEGPPMALLHGALLTVETNWSNQIPVFSRKYMVVAMDLRGHGRTDNPSNILDFNVMAEDVARLLEKLRLGKTHLIGFSMGGMIAIRLALHHPELIKTLTICSAGYHVSKESRDSFAENVNPEKMEESKTEWAAFYRRIHKGNGPDHWKKIPNQFERSPKHELSPADLTRINAPILIVVGDRDPYGFTRQAIETHDAIKGSELGIFPDTGHLVPEKKARLFNETVLDFLDRRGN